jgi:hydrogenase expression/formation protein HypC
MCLAIPGKILSIEETKESIFRTGIVSFDGIRKEINLAMVPEASTDDYVLVHVGVAINTIDEEEALRLLALYNAEATLDDEKGNAP